MFARMPTPRRHPGENDIPLHKLMAAVRGWMEDDGATPDQLLANFKRTESWRSSPSPDSIVPLQNAIKRFILLVPGNMMLPSKKLEMARAAL